MPHEEHVSWPLFLRDAGRNIPYFELDNAQSVILAILSKQGILGFTKAPPIHGRPWEADRSQCELAVQKVLATVPHVQRLTPRKVGKDRTITLVHPLWAVRRRDVHGFQ